MRGPRLVVAAIVVVLVAAGIVVGLRLRGAQTCGAATVRPRTLLADRAQMAADPHEQRDALVGAVDRMGSPFGPVVAGVDYYYGQFVHLYGVRDGLLAWTKDNAPVTYLDDSSLEPRWSLRPTSRRVAWDASADRFLLLDLDADEPGTVSSYDLGSGEQQWCVSLSGRQADGQPVATTFAPGGDVVTALPDGAGIRLSRLSGKDGAPRWSRTLEEAARADYLGMLTDDVLLVGGTEEYRLAQGTSPLTVAPVALAAVDVRTGRTVWQWAPGGGPNVHVIGVLDGTILAMARGRGGPVLTALDARGKVLWTRGTDDGGYEATLRGDLVLVNARTSITAYDATSGEPAWIHELPKGRTYFPYGFTLAQMPSLDADHLLLPTTTSLDVLELRTGSTLTYRLPTDGVSSTYWPYQLAVTPKHLAVVTNTGAVIAGRE